MDKSPLDNIDREIIRALQRNGRTSNTEIGRALGLTEATIRKRIARLIEGDLVNIVAVPTPRAVGVTMSAIIGISVNLGDLDRVSETLSGGNQQKIVLGRWLASKPPVLLLDEPTRGIDVGTKREIYGLMDGLARGGAAIVLVSSELPELLGLCDRIAVLREGRIVREFAHGATEEALAAAMAGTQAVAA